MSHVSRVPFRCPVSHSGHQQTSNVTVQVAEGYRHVSDTAQGESILSITVLHNYSTLICDSVLLAVD